MNTIRTYLTYLSLLFISMPMLAFVPVPGQFKDGFEFTVKDVKHHQISFTPLLKGRQLRVQCSADQELPKEMQEDAAQLGQVEATINGRDVSCRVFLEKKE